MRLEQYGILMDLSDAYAAYEKASAHIVQILEKTHEPKDAFFVTRAKGTIHSLLHHEDKEDAIAFLHELDEFIERKYPDDIGIGQAIGAMKEYVEEVHGFIFAMKNHLRRKGVDINDISPQGPTLIECTVNDFSLLIRFHLPRCDFEIDILQEDSAATPAHIARLKKNINLFLAA